MRYGGFSEPMEVQVAILNELKKQTELLAKLTATRPQEGTKPKEGVQRASKGSGRGNNRKASK